MKQTKIIAIAAVTVMAAVITVEAEGVALKVDQVRQRYPWNGLVDIDYTITDASAFGVDDNLEVLMVDKSLTPAVTNRAITFLQAPLPLTAGRHRVTWDANADGVTKRTDQAEFHVKVVRYAEVYMVIDVSGGADATGYPVDFLNGEPEGGFNTEEYKGDKIVLRRIRPGSYMAGSPEDEANRADRATYEKQHRVVISKPFYIGLFEITQQQYDKVMNKKPAQFQGECWRYRPVESVTYNSDIRGSGVTPSPNTFIGQLIGKCKSKDSTGEYTIDVTGFDLPTEFQWEYACRAGAKNALNITPDSFDNTKSDDHANQLKLLGRYKDNWTDGKGDSRITQYHTIVGSYLPNAWGLYDMHGNVWEICRDWWCDDPTALNPKQYKDPTGPTSGTQRVIRGGSCNAALNQCRAAYRHEFGPDGAGGNHGFRLFRALP